MQISPLQRLLDRQVNYLQMSVLKEVKEKKVKEVPATFEPETGTVDAVINLDWFECMVSGKLVEYGVGLDAYEYDGGRIILQLVKEGRMKSGTEFFKYAYKIFIDGKKFADILCETRNVALIKKDLIQLQLTNNVLYEVAPMAQVNYLFEKMGWTMHHLTRVDIALDGYGFLDIYKRYMKKEIKQLGRCYSRPYLDQKANVRAFDFGGCGGSGKAKKGIKWKKKITCYSKSDKLTIEHKPFIGDFWKRSKLRREMICEKLFMTNAELKKIGATEALKKKIKAEREDYRNNFGEDGLRKVERLELKLRADELKKIGYEYDLFDCWGAPLKKDSAEYKAMVKLNPFLGFQGIEWQRLDDFEYLAGIMKRSLRNYFEFINMDEYEATGNVSRCNRIFIVDWNKLGAIKLERCSTEMSARIGSAKISIKESFFCYLSSKKDYYLIIAQEMALNINDMIWFMRMQKKWTEQHKFIMKYFPERFQHYAKYKTTEAGEQLNLIEIPLQHNMYLM